MARRWAEELAAWAIDPAILAAAPESPYGFPPGLFGSGRGAAATLDAVRGGPPGRGRGLGCGRGGEPAEHLDAVRGGLPGSVLDVGCGGGAASVPSGAGELLGVDSSPEML